MTTRAWVNGRLLAADEPVLLANDHGLTVGDGIFETVKVVDGQPFAHDPPPATAGPVGRRAGRCPSPTWTRSGPEWPSCSPPSGRCRSAGCGSRVTGGPGPLGSERVTGATTYVVQAAAQDRPPPTSAAVTAPWVRNERSPVAGLKTTSYAENVVALAYAKERGASEALLANTRGELCEGTGSNVFVAVDGALVTPPLQLRGAGRDQPGPAAGVGG